MLLKLLIMLILIIFLFYFNFKNNIKESFEENIKIPKIIYKSSKTDFKNLSADIKSLFSKTLKNNPNFEIKYYSDDECVKFISDNFDSEVLKAFNKLKPGSYKADLFRYCILYKHGGIWSDLTDDFLVPLDEIINFDKDEIVLVKDATCLNYRGIQIGFMASIPKNKIFLDAINQIVINVNKNYYGKSPLDVSGPKLFYDILDNNKYNIYIKNIKIKFDGNGKTGCYLDIKTNKKLIKYKSLKDKLDNILNRTKTERYYNLWKKREIYNK